jgi:hypothetical protein
VPESLSLSLSELSVSEEEDEDEEDGDSRLLLSLFPESESEDEDDDEEEDDDDDDEDDDSSPASVSLFFFLFSFLLRIVVSRLVLSTMGCAVRIAGSSSVPPSVASNRLLFHSARISMFLCSSNNLDSVSPTRFLQIISCGGGGSALT